MIYNMYKMTLMFSFPRSKAFRKIESVVEFY